MSQKIVFTTHAGSGNHGCEAIVNSTCHMLAGQDISVISTRPWEDEAYSLGGLCHIKKEYRITESLPVHLFYLAKKLLTRDPMCYIEYRFQEALQNVRYDAAVSIGGDNYCYPEQVQDLMLLNRALNARGTKTVLWGVSIEPSLLKRVDVSEDMKRYAHIFARERITYEALLSAGVEESRVHRYPDPAFCLKAVRKELPEGFYEGNVVGINVSPMVMEREAVPGMVYQNYETLIEQILKNTQMNVALLSHVVWEANDDRIPLRRLYERFQESGRVIMLPDADCTILKGYIARMRFLVAARTHASIAAYSSQVPVLVAGYSVKAKGIAEELFGTAEGYVVPVQEMKKPDELWEAFRSMMEREAEIRQLLKERMPVYVEQAEAGGRKLREILNADE
ncbi:MAG: polysaccharide pyruvyl transferase family protein [Lachnospiraceae bacterium]|nr:polysaccharide pyruvyl transferase family protein [Lachnospiraceae bacterium]